MSNAFKEWVHAQNLVTYGKLEELSGDNILIDADDWLNTLLSAESLREPLLPAHGGQPFALRKNVDAELQHFKDADITPHFIFSGQELGCRDRVYISRDGRKAARFLDEAWKTYDQGHGEAAVKLFGQACRF